MRLLIITQKVDRNDQVLGFFHEWIKEFSKYYTVSVICLYKGEYDLPGVSVYSLGKESGESRIKYLFNLYKYLFTITFDKVFVHMNQIYVPLVWIFGKPVYLWYTHKQISLSLKFALLFAKKVFTASKESFRIESSKVNVMGHGIDTDFFVPGQLSRAVITIGRISKTKNIKEILDLTKDYKTYIVGAPITKDDFKYEKEIDKSQYPKAEFVGSVKPSETVAWLQKANVFINLSNTGSLDKAVLEAMSCGLNIITTNEAFSFAISPEKVKEKIAENIDKPLNLENREYVIDNHNLSKLIPNLVEKMK